jgi:homoserine dehydrogenase
VEVEDRPGVLAHLAELFAAEAVSIARLTQRQLSDGASLDIVTHDAPWGSVEAALGAIARLDDVRGRPTAFRVIPDEGP